MVTLDRFSQSLQLRSKIRPNAGPQANQASTAKISNGRSSLPAKAILFTGHDSDKLELSGPKLPKHIQGSVDAADYVDSLLDKCNKQPAVERMTLRDFLIKAKMEPQRYLPTASSYALDAFKHYEGPEGPQKVRVYGETLPQFKMMSAPWNSHLTDPPKVHGQQASVSRLWEILRTFKQQPSADRGIAFFGPHGSGKSIIPKTLMAGMEHFSKQDEGSLWTYSFVFPDGEKIKAQPEAEAKAWVKEVSQGKHLIEPDKIAAQLMANLNLNPIFLLSPKRRTEFLQDLKKEGKIDADFNVDYYLKSNLDSHSQKVLDKLHRLYSDDPQRFQKTLEHVQVERWTLSGQDYQGLVEVPASVNPDAVLRDKQGDLCLEKAPPLLKTLGQRTLEGLMPRAHRGVFYMDDFGRNGKSYDHLLMPLETGEVTIQEMNGGPGITKEQLDFIPMLSMNPEILDKARQDGKFSALEQRMLFVPVPYERQFKTEGKILEPIINRAKTRGKVITPNVLDSFSQWVTLTRMFPVDKSYKPYKEIGQSNKEFASGISKLNPLSKAMLYQGEMPAELTKEEFQALDENLKIIANEHTQSLGETEFSLYEGGVGISPRDAANMLKRITGHPGNDPISFIDVFEMVADYANNKPLYEQKRSELLKEKHKNMQFPSAKELLKQVEDHTRQNFMVQLKTALNMYQPQSVYVHRIQQYAEHIQAMHDGRLVARKYQVDGDSKPNMALINSFETAVHPGLFLRDKTREEYRTNFLTRAFDWNSSLPETHNVKAIYQNEMDKLRAKDEQLNKPFLDEFRNNVKILLKTPNAIASTQGRPSHSRMEHALNQLGQLGYPPETLPKILDWALDGRYVADQIQ